MKISILSLTLLTASFSFAESLVCQSMVIQDQPKYVVQLDKKMKKAFLRYEDQKTSQNLAVLHCKKVPAPEVVYPDQLVDLVNCESKNNPDSGYSVSVRTGGIMGLTMATLSEMTIMGVSPIDELICQYN